MSIVTIVTGNVQVFVSQLGPTDLCDCFNTSSHNEVYDGAQVFLFTLTHLAKPS
jgi:hypothetical protein